MHISPMNPETVFVVAFAVCAFAGFLYTRRKRRNRRVPDVQDCINTGLFSGLLACGAVMVLSWLIEGVHQSGDAQWALIGLSIIFTLIGPAAHKTLFKVVATSVASHFGLKLSEIEDSDK